MQNQHMTASDTNAIHAGREDLTALGVHAVPLDMSSTNPVTDVESGGAAYDRLATGGRPEEGDSYVYQRLWNPNVDRFERAIATLERASEAVAFATGMAATTAVLQACVLAGTPHIVAVRPVYGGTDHILASNMLGTRVTFTTPHGIADAIEADTGLVILETPANPSVQLVNIADAVAQAGDVPVMVDNTFATPVLQQPMTHGATLVMHSATKYIGGHGDLLGGVIAGPSEWAVRLRQVRAVTGGLLAPASAYYLHRGVQTLPVRVRAQQEGAKVVAKWLHDDPRISDVRYPGLEHCDPEGIVGTQMSGPGSMMAFSLAAGADAATKLLQRLSLIVHAVSLGGVDTLIQQPAGLTHRPVADGARPDANSLRLSVGLEDPQDIIRDLDAALSS